MLIIAPISNLINLHVSTSVAHIGWQIFRERREKDSETKTEGVHSTLCSFSAQIGATKNTTADQTSLSVDEASTWKSCTIDDEAFIYGVDYHLGPSGPHSNSSCPAEKHGPGALKINVQVQIAGLNKTSDTAMIAA